MKYALVVVTALILMLFANCNDASLVGSDLVTDDQTNIIFVDSLEVKTTTVPEFKVKTYDPNVLAQLISYMVGQVDDPIFGKSKSSAYFQLEPTTIPEFSLTSNDNYQFDSLVLMLDYSTVKYGDLSQAQDIEVFQLMENMDNSIEYYSDTSFMVGSTTIGSKYGFVPDLDNDVVIGEDTLDALLRIRMDDMLGETFMMQDSSVYLSRELFINYFNGLYLSPTTNNTGIMAFNLRSANSKMVLYYTKNDTLSQSFDFLIEDENVKLSAFEHDYTGATVEPYINNPTDGDSITFIQSMFGVNTKVEFPNAVDYFSSIDGNVIINKVELLATAIPETVDSIYTTPSQLLGGELLEGEEELFLIEDVALDVISLSVFGGGRVINNIDGSPLHTYTMSLSNHFQDVINGSVDDALYLSSFPKAEDASRVVLGGGKHSEHGLKLKVYYTIAK